MFNCQVHQPYTRKRKSTVIKNTDFGVKQLWLLISFRSLQAVWQWTSTLTSWMYITLIWKMGMNNNTCLSGFHKKQCIDKCKVLVYWKYLKMRRASLVAQTVQNPPAMWERPGFNPWIGKISWRRAWQPTPVFLPGESHGQRSLAGYSPGHHRKLDTAERSTNCCNSEYAERADDEV